CGVPDPTHAPPTSEISSTPRGRAAGSSRCEGRAASARRAHERERRPQGGVLVGIGLICQRVARRRLANPSPARPRPNNASVPGSGTVVGLGVNVESVMEPFQPVNIPASYTASVKAMRLVPAGARPVTGNDRSLNQVVSLLDRM